jgi:2-dehydropantoate 2-reductase
MKPLRVAVFGAGAIGGHLAVRLAVAGHAVGVVARGAQLAAAQAAGGLQLRVGEATLFGPLQARATAAELGPQDLVIATVKATALPDFAAQVAPLLQPETAVVFVQNGIPWWYAQGLSAQRPAAPDLSALDPGGALARAIAPQRVVGAVIYTSNEVLAPGLVVNDSPGANTLIVGEPDDSESPRILHLRQTLAAAGIASPPCADIRATLWRRLVVNVAGSVVCSIIEQPIGVHQADPAMGALFQRLSAEMTSIAAAHGVDLAQGTVPPGPPHRFPPQHKPSFLQDYERRRPQEVAAILQAPLAFARSAGIDAPALETITALAAHRAARRGLFQPDPDPVQPA